MKCPQGHTGPFHPIQVRNLDLDYEAGEWLQCRHPMEKKEDGYCDERFIIPEDDECCGFDTDHDK